MSDRVALVTGSTSGIGAAIARRLSRDGYAVALHSRSSADVGKRMASELRGGSYHQADLGDEAAVRPLIESVLKRHGRLDVLVNNAGIQFVSPIEDFPVEKWNAIIALNLSSAFHTIRAAMAHMKARRYGRIINIASAHGHVASPFKSAYVAAKHGILGLTKTVALEGAIHNVRCNAIAPGYVLTPLVENQIPDTMKARELTREQVINDVLLAAQPTKEFVTVEEVAGLAVFLTSPAADQINGASLNVDGGWTAQ